jgi:hypothetical protein
LQPVAAGTCGKLARRVRITAVPPDAHIGLADRYEIGGSARAHALPEATQIGVVEPRVVRLFAERNGDPGKRIDGAIAGDADLPRICGLTTRIVHARLVGTK